jgi:hypothetical protein
MELQIILFSCQVVDMLETVAEMVVMVDMGMFMLEVAAALVDILEMVEMLTSLVPHIMEVAPVDQVAEAAAEAQEDLLITPAVVVALEYLGKELVDLVVLVLVLMHSLVVVVLGETMQILGVRGLMLVVVVFMAAAEAVLITEVQKQEMVEVVL